MSNSSTRVRFSEDAVIDLTTGNKRKKTTKTEEPSNLTISSSEQSLSLVLARLALHPSSIIDLGTKLYKEFIKLIRERDDLYCRKLKLDPSTDFISNSMKLNFTLYGPDSLKSTSKFKSLSEECDTAIEAMQLTLKEKSLKVVELEIKELKEKIKLHYCESVHLLATVLVKNELGMKESPGIRHLIIAVFEFEYTDLFAPNETKSQVTRISDYDTSETDDAKQTRFNIATGNLSTDYSKLLFFAGIPSKLQKRADLQHFFNYFYLSIKNMTGYIIQENYTAGHYVRKRCMNLSFLEKLPATLTSLLKCIFFDSCVEYQSHREQNSHTAKLKNGSRLLSMKEQQKLHPWISIMLICLQKR